jgi:hypothetical protein
MNGKVTSRALMIALVLHATIAFVVGIYLLGQTSKFKDLIGIEILQPKERPKSKISTYVVKPDAKPTVPMQNTVIEQIQVQPRTETIFRREPRFRAQTVLKFSRQTVKVQPPTDPNVPKVVALNPRVPTGVIHGDLLVLDAPDALAFSAPVVTTPSTGMRNVIRGIAGQLKVTPERLPGLAMVENVGAVSDALDDVVENVTLSKYTVPPLPKGEPGARVIGKGRDIQGVFRFTRIRHTLSDWWADASALNALTIWLNERTKIKTDMNVEGGALKLTDASLFKTPLVFMTGHDPAVVRSRDLLGNKYGAGRIDGRFSDNEAAGLRRYLVEKGGFLVFDDCGVEAPAQAMVRLFLAQMRYVMPEYHIERISNNHEVYNNFYGMGGPPIGYDIFWWGTRPPKRNYLEGISVGEQLSVIVIRRDYMCSMETVSLPVRSVHYSPGVYRFMTNVVVYALTHSSISDYSGYIPESVLIKKALPKHAPAAARVGGFE